MASNAEIEMRWIDAWSELIEIVGQRPDVPCQLPDWSVIDVKQCQGWLQTSVYEGYLVHVAEGWVGHKKGVLVSRTRPAEL